MIVYELACETEHRFEGWFRNADDCDSQIATGLLTCPLCGSAHVRKIPTSHVTTSHPREADPASAPPLAALRTYVERHFEDVGTGFCEEARKIHYGEAAPRDIRGTATDIQVRALKEEGIDALRLPLPPGGGEKLN